MPKLNQAQVEAAKSQGYTQDTAKPKERQPLPIVDGKPYVYKLVSCTSGPAKSNPNRIQWTWELTLDSRYHPEFCTGEYLERLWHYTAEEGGQEWAIAKMFHAFGYSPDTDTDELINDEATVLAFLTVETYVDNSNATRTKMRARRFAQHYEEEVPQANSPILEEAQAKMAQHAAEQGIPQGPEHPASVANPTGSYATEDPWATPAPAAPQTDPWATAPAAPQAPAPVVPPQPQTDENDTF